MLNKLKFIYFSLICLTLFVLPLFTFAQEKFFGEATTATGMIRNIYWFGVGIVGFVAVVVLVIAGIMYMQSYGDPQKITMAKQLIGGALIGVVLLLFSYTILRTVNPALVSLREPELAVELPECSEEIKDYPCEARSGCSENEYCVDTTGNYDCACSATPPCGYAPPEGKDDYEKMQDCLSRQPKWGRHCDGYQPCVYISASNVCKNMAVNCVQDGVPANYVPCKYRMGKSVTEPADIRLCLACVDENNDNKCEIRSKVVGCEDSRFTVQQIPCYHRSHNWTEGLSQKGCKTTEWCSAVHGSDYCGCCPK